MKVLYGILLILLIFFIIWIPGPFIWGLVSDYKEKREARNEVEDAALPLAENYLETHYSDAVITELAMNTSAMSYGKPNRYAVAQYTSGDAAETLLIDTRSGQIWDSMESETMQEALTDFLEEELALPDEHHLEVGWQILKYDEDANGGAFEEMGYYFVPADCETPEDLLDEVMITVAVKYPASTHASRTTAPQNARALFETYADCNATIWVVIMDSLQSEKLYEGNLLYKGYGCAYYIGAGVVRSFHLTNK